MGTDEREWILSKDGTFSVASFFMALVEDFPHDSPLVGVWRLRIMPRVTVFDWLAIRGNIITIDNLRRNNVLTVNACPLCLKVKESMDHLLLACDTAQGLWRAFLVLFGCEWVLSRRVDEHFQSWNLAVDSKRGRMMWRLSLMADLWSLWKERNVRCFG